jgi:hypothetical protein
MPVYEIYNADGSLQFDLSGRVPRILGSLTISAAGSLSNPGFLKGALFYTLNPTANFSKLNGYPAVTLSGQTLSWGAPSEPLILIYGVY